MNGLSGLINMGNTCYLNAAIQCLSNTQPLTELFVSKRYLEEINIIKKEAMVCREYARLTEALWEDQCIVKPESFKKTIGLFEPKFNNYLQHDSQEILSILINLLHTGLSYKVKINPTGIPRNKLDEMQMESIKIWMNYFKNEYSRILDIFFGQYYSRLVCPNCNYVSHSYDPFCMITLPIGEDNIYDCFNKFTQPEQLNNDNQWKCDNCHQYCNVSKQITIWKPPQILIIVLKRFDYLRLRSSKITNKIDFPLDNLDLSAYVSGYEKYETKYNAYAIINHTGTTNYGHYTAYCKNITNNKWYHYDDQNVSEIGQPTKDNAYVIFYKKI